MEDPKHRLFPGEVLARKLTPRGNRTMQPDNVYADSAPYNKKGMDGRRFSSTESQTMTHMAVGSGAPGDPTYDPDMGKRRRRGHKRRGKKSQVFDSSDSYDDETMS